MSSVIPNSIKNFIVTLSGDNTQSPIEHKDFSTYLPFKSDNFKIELYFNDKENIKVFRNDLALFVIKGDLIPKHNNFNFLHETYKRYGDKIFSKIEGSFALTIIDYKKEQVLAGTDLLNSFKLFTGKIGKTNFIAGSIYSIPSIKTTLDTEAIYHYIINGAVLENKTLFREISLVPQASYLKLTKSRKELFSYCDFAFTSMKVKPKENYINELQNLLNSSIGKRINPQANLILSLSGGYDATALLGLLVQNGFANKLKAVSYYYSRILKSGDAWTAKEQAALAGIEFEAYEAYNADITTTIAQNAIMGQGLAPYSNEVNFWTQLHNNYPSPGGQLITGEEFFGWSIENHPGRIEAYKNIGLRTFKSLSTVNKFIPSETQVLFSDLDKKIVPRIIHSVDSQANIFDYKCMLYFKQSLPHILLPWREFYNGAGVIPATPLLDKDIIDFIFNLPVKHRLNKVLFKETVNNMFPELFRIPRASINNNAPDWSNILPGSCIQIEAMLSEESDLDSYFPVSNILALIKYKRKNSLKRKTKFAGYLTTTGKRISLISYLQGRILPDVQIGWDTFLLRLLTLRQFLNYYSNRDDI